VISFFDERTGTALRPVSRFLLLLVVSGPAWELACRWGLARALPLLVGELPAEVACGVLALLLGAATGLLRGFGGVLLLLSATILAGVELAAGDTLTALLTFVTSGGGQSETALVVGAWTWYAMVALICLLHVSEYLHAKLRGRLFPAQYDPLLGCRTKFRVSDQQLIAIVVYRSIRVWEVVTGDDYRQAGLHIPIRARLLARSSGAANDSGALVPARTWVVLMETGEAQVSVYSVLHTRWFVSADAPTAPKSLLGSAFDGLICTGDGPNRPVVDSLHLRNLTLALPPKQRCTRPAAQTRCTIVVVLGAKGTELRLSVVNWDGFRLAPITAWVSTLKQPRPLPLRMPACAGCNLNVVVDGAPVRAENVAQLLAGLLGVAGPPVETVELRTQQRNVLITHQNGEVQTWRPDDGWMPSESGPQFQEFAQEYLTWRTHDSQPLPADFELDTNLGLVKGRGRLEGLEMRDLGDSLVFLVSDQEKIRRVALPLIKTAHAGLVREIADFLA
jgi:hypothetical protein